MNQIDTVKAFKERNKLGRFANSTKAEPSPSENTPVPGNIKIGARTRLQGEGGILERRGTVKFIGPTKFGKQDGSVWIGVELDEPVGKNSGS